MTIEELEQRVEEVLSSIQYKEESRFIATIGGKNILYIMFDKTIENASTIKLVRSYGFCVSWHSIFIEADCLPFEFEVYPANFPNPDSIKVEKSSNNGKLLPPLNVSCYVGEIYYNDVCASYKLFYKGEYLKGVLTKDETGWYQAFGESTLGEYVKWLIEHKNILK